MTHLGTLYNYLYHYTYYTEVKRAVIILIKYYLIHFVQKVNFSISMFRVRKVNLFRICAFVFVLAYNINMYEGDFKSKSFLYKYKFV